MVRDESGESIKRNKIDSSRIKHVRRNEIKENS